MLSRLVAPGAVAGCMMLFIPIALVSLLAWQTLGTASQSTVTHYLVLTVAVLAFSTFTGNSGILSFGIKGGREAGAKFIDALDLILRLVNIGDAKSLACHPATTTHRQLDADELKSAGVSEDLVRLSIGIEDVEDIIADVAQALEKSQA